MCVFLGMLFIYRACHGPRRANDNKIDPSSRGSLRTRQNPAVKMGLPQSHSKGLVGRSLLSLQVWYNPFLFPIIAGMLLLLAINIVFLINIELTLWDNRRLRGGSESIWTFGQILAVILLVLPLRDLRIFGARRNFTSSLQNAVRWHADTDVLRDLVRRGANVNVTAEGSRYPTLLLLAVCDRKDVDFVGMLLVYGADPNVRDSTDRTPLQCASSCGDLQIVRLLLANGADPNIEGGEYGTPLQAVSHSGNREIVQLLLERGADVNMQGGKYGTALEAASACGYEEIVELLRANGAVG
ncbi:Multiple ankyrin repeats single kh domain [Mycena venus]|uniref:Multiple ankyrin repeats single kh domain n=1 Tax=Mycena venus TaxID=2733690 RepID=A0A8H6XD87_9AGAR|nr:Multiple ankyrin repeats single kh domain [Mycena venus]